MVSRDKVNRIREMYPVGTRVRLNNMPDDPHPIPPGTEGEVIGCDDAGQLQMKWSNGRTLSLIPGVDDFSVISKPAKEEEMNWLSPQANKKGGKMKARFRFPPPSAGKTGNTPESIRSFGRVVAPLSDGSQAQQIPTKKIESRRWRLFKACRGTDADQTTTALWQHR